MKPPRRLRRDTDAVSEVIGTILILGMTVALFSVIIIWVASFPTPAADLRLELDGTLAAVTDLSGNWAGANITITHRGGETINYFDTRVYITILKATGARTVEVLRTRGTVRWGPNLGQPYGLVDGRDNDWSIGERWVITNRTVLPTDRIRAEVVDVSRGILWSEDLLGPVGTHPPLFLEKWADGFPTTDIIDPVQAGIGFTLYARVTDPDADLNTKSVYATITAWYGTFDPCEQPLQMKDDGIFPDRVAGDGVFTLGGNRCMGSPFPYLSWAGTIILFNATDLRGLQASSRMVLNVVPQTSGGSTQRIPSELWQYIGYVQIRTGEVWTSNLNLPYSTTTTYQPYRITKDQLNGNGGALFHFKMANHGNTTIFIDGWTMAYYKSSQSSSGFPLFIAAPCDATKPANAGGIAAYPGTTANPNDFQYARGGAIPVPAGCKSTTPPSVFDINPTDQETGGTPYVVLVAAKTPFSAQWPQQFGADSLFINILISGMAGPANMTYQQIVNRWGPTYNPINHLSDADPTTRTTWYAQVIPFIGMVVY